MPNVIGVISAKLSVQARVPNKVLLPLSGHTTMLRHHMERMYKATDHLDGLWVATSRWPGNEHVKAEATDGIGAHNHSVFGCFEGSEHDVIQRHIDLCKKANADAFIRVTCDCPLFDYEIIEHLVGTYRESGCDYVYVRNVPFECSIMPELVSLEAIERAHKYYQGPAVTLPVWEHHNEFNIASIEAPPAFIRPEYNLTVNTPPEYMAMVHLYTTLYDGTPVPLANAYKWLEDNPYIAKYFMRNEHSDINRRFMEAQKNAQ